MTVPDSRNPAAPPLSRPAAWGLAIAATLTMSVSYIDRQTLAAIAPSVQKGLGFEGNELLYSLLGSAFAIAYLVGAPVAGRVIDRVGARRGLLTAVVVWSTVAALHAVAPVYGVLLAMRVLLGLAESPSFPAAAQTIQRALPPADRARGFGVLFTGSSIGAAIAPPLATWLADRYSFRFAFFGTAAAGLLWIPLWLALAYNAPARAALDRSYPTPPLRRVLHPAVLRSMMPVMASAPLIAFAHTWATKYLVHDHHLTQRAAGNLLAAPPLLFDLGSVAFGHLTSMARARGAVGVPRPLLAASATAMLAGAAIPFAGTPQLAVVALCAMMFGGGGMYALGMVDMAARVPQGMVSAGGGMLAATQSVAQIATNFAIGSSVMATGSYTFILIALSVWVVPPTLAWLAWPPAEPARDE